MNSSLTFQKLLWFHAAFDIVYTMLMLGALFHKLMVRHHDILTIVVAVLKVLWLPLEIARLRFGYSGNINETFPELIAFLIFTLFFIVPLSALPAFQNDMFPHEMATICINLLFVFFEFILGCVVMHRFMQT